MNSALMFSKASDEWSTPKGLFEDLDAEFDFELDAAANQDNALCGTWFGFGSFIGYDGLAVPDWIYYATPPMSVWLNPPYSRCAEFVAKAASEAQKGCTVVMLIPSRTDTKYWHAHIWDTEKHQTRPGVEVRFIKGRLKFGNQKNSAPFPSCVVVFRP